MKKLTLTIALMLAPTYVYAWPWSQDMANQVSVKPQESPDPANPGMRAFPKHSVPKPGTTTFVKDADTASQMKNPVAADAKSVETGRQLFNIYCTPCHGPVGKGDGLVGQKLILQPFNLTEGHAKDTATDGFIFGYMTLGGAIMPSYANDLSATERWHVVNYIRKVLQADGGPAQTAAASK
jgi:mono/diheme cytochrome c family protein